jgi:cytoplasmic iron level regulating protein YaaA (DUF328/UPF0246 family)
MLLSPAKSLSEGPAVAGFSSSQPAMADESEKLLKTTRRLSSKKLQALMNISVKLGDLNRERFAAMTFPHEEGTARQAILMFNGDVYRGLDAASLDPADLDWANDRVAILSGFYGVLRPLDLMQPYRLEMGTKLKTRRGPTLYTFWGDRIAKQLNAMLDGDQTVVNLASNEYFSSVNTKKLDATVITPVFRDIKDGKARTLSFFAKQARGAMVRWAVVNRVTDAEQLEQCDVMGYTFVPEASTADRWEFHRQQPPPVNG